MSNSGTHGTINPVNNDEHNGDRVALDDDERDAVTRLVRRLDELDAGPYQITYRRNAVGQLNVDIDTTDDHPNSTFFAINRLIELFTAELRVGWDPQHHISGPAIVAVDIDGVLNVDEHPHRTRHDICIPAGTLDSPFVRGSVDGDRHLTIWVDPGVVAWLNGLAARADVVWATTWEHAAADVFAPAVGLDTFDVAVTSRTHPPRFGHAVSADSMGWKAEVLGERYVGRPLVWVDDSFPANFTHHVWRHPQDDPHTLCVDINSTAGITDAERSLIDAFVDRYTTR